MNDAARELGASGISVVVPVYNSATTLPRLVDTILRALETTGRPHELILVNDGSHDDSWTAVERETSAHQQMRGVDLTRNYGQHNALLCGIREARFDIVVTLDDDLQHPPEEITRLIEELEAGHDLVYGVPEKPQQGRWRPLASWLTRLVLQSTLGAHSASKVSAFRAFRTSLRDAFASYQGPFVSLDVLLSWSTSRVGAIGVRHAPREVGRSHYTLRGLLTHTSNLMTGMTIAPLQLATLIGLSLGIGGIGILVFVVGRYLLYGSPVAGFPFLASIIAVFSGAQLFSLGIIGAYLARVHFHVMQRPTYVVRRRARVGSNDDPAG